MGGIDCIHGHFLPLKYLLLKNAIYITWMRDPVERLASHYHFWRRTYNPEEAPPLRRRVVEENWSLEKFCFSPELRNFYCQFLWGFPIENFDFIGITEYYNCDMEYLSQEILGVDLLVYQENINNHKGTAPYFDDHGLRKEIENYHSKDVAIYRRALQIRNNRKKSSFILGEVCHERE
jgi:hypothetical protein